MFVNRLYVGKQLYVSSQEHVFINKSYDCKQIRPTISQEDNITKDFHMI